MGGWVDGCGGRGGMAHPLQDSSIPLPYLRGTETGVFVRGGDWFKNFFFQRIREPPDEYLSFFMV